MHAPVRALRGHSYDVSSVTPYYPKRGRGIYAASRALPWPPPPSSSSPLATTLPSHSPTPRVAFVQPFVISPDCFFALWMSDNNFRMFPLVRRAVVPPPPSVCVCGWMWVWVGRFSFPPSSSSLCFSWRCTSNGQAGRCEGCAGVRDVDAVCLIPPRPPSLPSLFLSPLAHRLLWEAGRTHRQSGEGRGGRGTVVLGNTHVKNAGPTQTPAYSFTTIRAL